MKKIVYLLLGIIILSGAGFAKRIPITISNDPVNGFQMVKGSVEREITTMQQAQPFIPSAEKSRFMPDFLAAETIETDVIWQTRYHDYPENMQDQDTARVLSSRVDPTRKWYIGDRHIPTQVVDAQGNTIFLLNGFAQFVPSIKFFFPQLLGGTFTVDSIRFTMYSYPNSPVQSGMLYTIVNFPSNAGTAQFTGINHDLELLLEDVVDIDIISADSINARTERVTQTSFNIRPTILSFQNFTQQNKFPSNNTFGFLFFKEFSTDFRDTLGMIGAWEWGLTDAQANQTMAATVCVYPGQGRDTVRTLFNTIAPPRPTNPSEWPQVASQTRHKMNFTFLIKGFYEGEYDPNPTSVEEISAIADGFAIESISPNPAQDIANVRFAIQKGERVSMNIYNALGQNVLQVMNEYKTPGTYNATFDVGLLPSGTYYISLTSNNHSVTRALQVVN